MIQKFEEIGNLGVMRGRGRKRISNETVDEVAFAIVERESGSQNYASSTRAVSRDLSLPWSAVRKILSSILKWYPYKNHFRMELCATVKPNRSGKSYNFATSFLSGIIVHNEWP